MVTHDAYYLFHEPSHHQNIDVVACFQFDIPYLSSFLHETERGIERDGAAIGGEHLQAKLLQHGMLFHSGD